MCVVFWFDVLEIAYVWCTGVCCSEHLSTLSIYLSLHAFLCSANFFGGNLEFLEGKLFPPDVLRINPDGTAYRIGLWDKLKIRGRCSKEA